MRVEGTDLPGVVVVHRDVHRDDRGSLVEIHHAHDHDALGLPSAFDQVNHTRSRGGVLRGLHFQRTHPQGKLVTVVRGTIFDVVADVRPGHATYRTHVARTLTDDGTQLWIPPGYAHGFCVLSDEADVVYQLTGFYRPDDGRGIRWDDPELAIPWPVDRPVVSDADAAWPHLAAAGVHQLPGPV